MKLDNLKLSYPSILYFTSKYDVAFLSKSQTEMNQEIWNHSKFSLSQCYSSLPMLKMRHQKKSGVNIFHENRNYSLPDPKNYKTFPKFKKKKWMTDHSDFCCFRRSFYSFTKASVINMDDYTFNIQFYHWNEVLIEKD